MKPTMDRKAEIKKLDVIKAGCNQCFPKPLNTQNRD